MIRRLALLMLVLPVLFLVPKALSEPLRTGQNLRHETVLLPLSTPETGQLALVGYAVVANQDNALGVVFIYDDAQTQREADYIELYDETGDLLLVSWIDHCGIRQVAVDRGLLRDEGPEVERVLVLIPYGTVM